ncbi:TonB C-terminal domain-containing protein [Bdellovibrionota bacterium FG-1]
MMGSLPVLPVELPTEITTPRWRHWIAAAILALLFHVALLGWHLPDFLIPPATHPRVDIKTVDPRKLEAIRRQWKEREKQLLINKNPATPSAAEPPADARYMSDRNIRVEKEQRARQTTIIPKSGIPGESSPPQPAPQPKTANHPLPALGNLGIPLPRAMRQAPPTQPPTHSGQEGGDQAISDRDLPEGSENLLNAQESVYYSFYSRLYEAIGPIWQRAVRQASRTRRLQQGEYSTQLDVVFDREGNLVAIHQLRSSGVADFDKSASTSWHAVGRFPNPPTGLLNENGEVHTGWTFTVQVNQGLNLDYLPPERVY